MSVKTESNAKLLKRRQDIHVHIVAFDAVFRLVCLCPASISIRNCWIIQRSSLAVKKPSKCIQSPNNDNPLLNELLKAQRSTFTNRYAAHLQAYFGDGARIKMGIKNPNFADTNLTVACEFPVLIEYLRISGFESAGLTRSEMVIFY